MKTMKVFDIHKDFVDKYPCAFGPSNVQAFNDLDLLKGNDGYVAWQVADWEWNLSEENDYRYKEEEYPKIVAAAKFVNEQLLKADPNLNKEEEILISVWW